MTVGVWVIVAIGTLAWWTLLQDDSSKRPADEQVIFTHETDKRSGELFDVQITKCRRCGQVISWVRFNHLGLPAGGYMREHHDCGRVFGKPQPIDGAGLFGRFDLDAFLGRWQRRLSRK